MSSGNKRRALRLHHEIPVAYRSVGSFLSDWATNISHGGLFINTRSPLPVGTEVTILLQLPGVLGAIQPLGIESRKAALRALKELETFRNDLAHAQDIVPEGWRRIAIFSQRLDALLEAF